MVSKALTDSSKGSPGGLPDLQTVVKTLNAKIRKLTSEKPLILISFDEIDSVLPFKFSDEEVHNAPSYYTMLSALNVDNVPSVMVTALSTLGYVFHVAPTSYLLSKLLGIDEVILQPVFIELPFDVHARPINETQCLEDLCDVEILSTYGRPM